MLTRKAVAACREHGVGTLVLVGGVAANSRVRALGEERCRAAGITLRGPPPGLCTDNGAMIAAVGDLLVRSGPEPSPRRWMCPSTRRRRWSTPHYGARTGIRAA